MKHHNSSSTLIGSHQSHQHCLSQSPAEPVVIVVVVTAGTLEIPNPNLQMVEDDDSIPDHKHCGFLSAVLAINPPQTLDSGTRCHIFGDGSEVGFRSENDVILSPVDSKAKTSTGDSGECSRRKRKRGIGLVHGSISVVRQIHALVVHKCVKIVARVVRVCGEARAVVLVDVYLPIELWSGWQFPRSASTAGALFRHLRCNIIALVSSVHLEKCIANDLF